MRRNSFNSPTSRPVAAIRVLLCLFLLSLTAGLAYAQKDDRALTVQPPTAVKELPNKAKRFALIIGVDQYADTQITTLGGASNDAKALANTLIQYAGFPEDQVTVLASDQPAERQPTRGNILRRLSNLSAVIPQDGLLLFAYAGHGIERSGQAFLLPSDAQVSNDVDLLEQTAINVAQVKDKIRKTGVKQVLVFLDACRNDPMGRANADNPLTRAYTKGFNFDTRNREVTAFAIIYATAVGQRAYEYKEKRQGYFTWALVEGLRGGAANDKKEVTLEGLIKYLQESVPKRVYQDLGQGKEQRPFAMVEGYKADNLVIAMAGAKPPAKQNAAPEMPPATRPIESKPNVGSTDQSLEGTTWTGTSVESGTFTIEFLKNGIYRYTISTGSVTGTWKQVGNYVQLVMRNGYSVLEGTIEGQLIKIEGSNREGLKWHWVLTQKVK